MILTLSNFNWLDYLFSGIFLFFILLSFWRGLVKEIISITAWVAGLLIAFAFAPKLAALFANSSSVQTTLMHTRNSVSEHITTSSPFLVGSCFIVLLVGVLLIAAMINYLMAKVVEASGMGFFNRLLGSILGLVKGFVVNLVIIVCMQMTAFAEKPAYEQSQCVQAYQPAITWLEDKMGPEFVDLKAKVKKTLDNNKQDTKSGESRPLNSFMNSFTGMFSRRS